MSKFFKPSSISRLWQAGTALLCLLPVGLAVAQGAGGATEAASMPLVAGAELDSLAAPALRMVLSLAAVLLLVGVFAWVARKFRGQQLKGGLIQIVSGVSLGPKERVVLLRVGEQDILVGLSPSGMAPLHVMGKASDDAPLPQELPRKKKTPEFSLDMASNKCES